MNKGRKSHPTAARSGWSTLALDKSLQAAIKRMGYAQPTPIQKKTLPLSLAGRDVVAMARTGAVPPLLLRRVEPAH